MSKENLLFTLENRFVDNFQLKVKTYVKDVSSKKLILKFFEERERCVINKSSNTREVFLRKKKVLSTVDRSLLCR